MTEKINRYEIIREIGRGGMATVYLAHDPNFDRNVVIKVLSNSVNDDAMLKRFQREAKTIASIEHPAIVPVYDYGEENDQPYIVMRYMTGGSLEERLANGSVNLADTAVILQRICSALDTAHQAGVVHRDLKPGNILFDDLGNAYLADFGIAYQLKQTDTKLTGHDSAVGTPGYMSPEQIQGDEVDSRSDIYALGAIVYEMLTGIGPFAADSPAMAIVKQMTEPVKPLSDIRPDLPRQVDQIVQQALQKEREKRPSTAVEIAQLLKAASRNNEKVSDLLQQMQTEKVNVEPAAAIAKEPSAARDIPYGWLVAAGLLLVILIGGFFLLNNRNGTNNEIADLEATATAVNVQPDNVVATVEEVVPTVELEIVATETAVPPTATPLPTNTPTATPTPTLVPPTVTATTPPVELAVDTTIAYAESFDDDDALEPDFLELNDDDVCNFSIIEGVMVITHEAQTAELSCGNIRWLDGLSGDTLGLWQGRFQTSADGFVQHAATGVRYSVDLFEENGDYLGYYDSACAIHFIEGQPRIIFDIYENRAQADPTQTDLLYYREAYNIAEDSWYTIGLNVDQEDMGISCTVNGSEIGRFVPPNPEEVRSFTFYRDLFSFRVENSGSTYLVDDLLYETGVSE